METTKDILKRVRKIEIKTRGLSQQIFSGHYHSAFKGRGMAFSEVREYQYGDDIRNIDWNVTARLNHPYIKVFEEERELTVMLMVDVSGSNEFGTQGQLKEEMMTEISAVLAFSAIHNNDKVGIIFFSDQIEKFIPPKKGTQHILRIIRELLDFKPEHQQTDISQALGYLTNAIKKRCTTFILSDFIDTDYTKALQVAGNKHDIVALRIRDHREGDLPSMGLMQVFDKEQNHHRWINSSSAKVRSDYKKWWEERERNINQAFLHSGIDHTIINTGEDFVKPLVSLFKLRESRF